MALLVPDEGEVQLLGMALGKLAQDTLTLCLYTNAGPPAEGDTLATYTEPAGNGYANIDLTAASWTVATVTGTTSADYAQQTFTFSGGPVTVNGYFMKAKVAAKVLWAEAFSSAANIPSGGGSIKITPHIELA